MRQIVCPAIFMLICLTVAVGADPQKPVRRDVTIKDMKFDPDALQIAPGETVVWTNRDDRDHTVTAKDGSFKSDNLSKADTFEHVFKKTGKFSYACSYHPRMKGSIVVKGD